MVFPKENIFKDLDDYLKSIPFEIADSGKAVMRHGSKKENATYMMPVEVQKKHSIEKFIVIQILGDNNSMLASMLLLSPRIWITMNFSMECFFWTSTGII